MKDQQTSSSKLFQLYLSTYHVSIWLEVKHRLTLVLMKREIAKMYLFSRCKLILRYIFRVDTLGLVLFLTIFQSHHVLLFVWIINFSVLWGIYSMLILFMAWKERWMLKLEVAPVDFTFVGSVLSVSIKVIFQIYFLWKTSIAVFTNMVLDL